MSTKDPLLILRQSTLALLVLAAVPVSAGASQELETVQVTATRIAQDGSALPLAWSAISGDAVARTGAVHINEIMQRVPGSWVSRGNGQESLIALRSPVLTGAGGCGSFYTAADGISLRAPGFCNVNQLFDANSEQAGRIEVIKGPATALYGSNALQGVINILSATPSADLDHRLAVEAGPHAYYRAKYRYSDTDGRHGISLRGNISSDGGYKDDSGYDQQKLTLRHDYSGDRWDIRSVLDVANLNQDTAGFIKGYKAYEDSHLKKSNPNPNAYRDARSLRFYTTFSRALDENNKLMLTPYLRDNKMEFLQHFLPWQSVEKNGHRSVGLRASVYSEAGHLHWVNGIDLEYTDGWLKEFQREDFSPNQPAGIHYDYNVDATTAAAYSQVQLRSNSPWELNAGARLEYTGYDYHNHTTDGPACAPSASACRFYRTADRDDNFADWSLNGGISYHFNPQLLAYTRLARGFRAPQATELYRLQAGQQRARLNSEKLDTMEIGLRGRWRDELRYDLALYHQRKNDVIFQDADRQNISGAKTRSYGAELSLNYQLSRHWQLALDATVARHQYDSHVQLLGSATDIKGNDMDTAPNAFGSARLRWDLQALTARDTVAELEWVALGNYFLDPDNRHKYGGHDLLNLRIGSALASRWSATLRLTNLLDEDYAERADYGFGQYRYFVGEPRAAYLEVAYQFGRGD